ncbi:AMP-binding protein [Conexibacter sp. W3-3-2]|uniref:class I adenylate-forming enzyme family protein n=1 Tax=Conexibacter sp. W3-3-2 TaxID=2675227 RepID=UPI001328CD9C|nr:class I adenylate-forming enzyme family protein [Conexibacter sp. W3-3-2]MTD43090.1 AMP-binding protein [Conexibacter sp. W3-3-2]
MLIDVLRTAAEAGADTAIIGPDGSIGYAELVARAERLAAGLAARGVERFAVACHDPLAVVALLAASSRIGAEACVYPRALDDAGVAESAQRLGHDLVVVDAPRDTGAATALVPAELEQDGALPPQPQDAPVLILTTGTSGTPKGVRHEWRRLIAAVPRGADAIGRRWLLAYNLNQFAGFQVLLHAVVHRATLVVPRSSQARDALDALVAHEVSHVSATPTFWRLLAGQAEAADGPPPALAQITLGGEATPGPLIERLRAVFPDARITHVYAGTEFGSAIAITDGEPGLPASVLERGEDADVRFRVVDGELHVRSRHAMRGYHGAAEHEGWIATGDLVEERDGRLHFVGRTVEIINVGGAKVHPLPIEELVSTVPGIAVAAVYGAPNAITGQIVAIDVVLEPGADEAVVKKAVYAACSVLPAPGRPRRLRFVDALETRGDKIVRTTTQEQQ